MKEYKRRKGHGRIGRPRNPYKMTGQTSLRFDAEDLKWLTDYAWSQRMPLSVLVRMIVRDFINAIKRERGEEIDE